MSQRVSVNEDRAPHRARLWALIAVAAVLSLACVGLAVAALVPSLVSSASAEVVAERQAFDIGDAARIAVGDGWSAQPLPAPDEGFMLLSPDRVLEVVVQPAGEGADEALRSSGQVLEEQLGNGAFVRHVTTEAQMLALLELENGAEVVIEAGLSPEAADAGAAPAEASARFDDYRVALGELLVGIEPAA